MTTLMQRLTTHHALAGFAMGLFLAVQTLFLLEKGIGLWHIGILFGTFGATTALLELPLGAVADVYGRVRIYALSRMLTLAGVILAIVLDSFWALIPAIVLMGLARALDSGSIEAWQVDQLKVAGMADRIPTAITRFHAAKALAIAAGALIGGYLPDWLATLTPMAMRPTEWNLAAQAVATAVHLFMLPLLLHEGDPVQPADHNRSVREQLRIAVTFGFGNLRLRGLFLTAFAVGLVMFTIEAYWQPRVSDIAPEAGYSIFGWLATGYFLAAALGPMILGRVQRCWTLVPDTIIRLILIALAPVLALLALQNSLGGFIPTYLVFMLVLSMINAPFEIMMAKEAPGRVRSTLFSVLSLSLQAGGVVMAYGLSFTVRWLGIGGLWMCLAGLLLVAGLSLNRRDRWGRRKSIGNLQAAKG